MGSACTRLLHLVGRATLFLLITLAMAEVALQIAAQLFHGRAGDGWSPGASVRVLAVGDSHTYGALVPEPSSYPATLQRRLDQRAPGVFSVLNLGVPGMSTAQLRKRLPGYVSRYEPNIVVIWCGVNDRWNRADADASRWDWLERLDGLAFRLRLYRLVRTALHDRTLERADVAMWEGRRHKLEADDVWSPDTTWTTQQGSLTEAIQHERGDLLVASEMEARVVEDLQTMVDWLRAGGYDVVLMAYPLDVKSYAMANVAIRRVAREQGVPLIESRVAVARVPPARRKWLWSYHPNGPMYGEIARDLAAVILRLRGRG